MSQESTQTNPVSPRFRFLRHKILWLLVGIFIAYIGLNTVMFWVSLDGRPDLVSKDYYEKSKAYNEVTTQREASHRLGWQVRLIPSGTGQAPLALWVTDRGGASLPGLNGEVRAYRPSDASLDQTLTLTESPTEPGLYRTAPTSLRKGLWELSVRLARGDEVFIDTIRHVAE